MPAFGRIALTWWVAASPALPPLLAQDVPSAGNRARLGKLVVSVQDADYRGDLTRLRSLAATVRYWRGFAHWRHAEAALALQPNWHYVRDNLLPLSSATAAFRTSGARRARR